MSRAWPNFARRLYRQFCTRPQRGHKLGATDLHRRGLTLQALLRSQHAHAYDARSLEMATNETVSAMVHTSARMHSASSERRSQFELLIMIIQTSLVRILVCVHSNNVNMPVLVKY